MSLPSIRALTAGNALSASIAALTKNDMKPRPTPCFFLKRFLVLGPQVHDPRHVGLVEGRQDRGGLLGLDQPLGDPLADAAHPLPGLARPAAPAARARRGPAAAAARCGRGAAAPPAARGRRRRAEVREDVALGDPAAAAGRRRPARGRRCSSATSRRTAGESGAGPPSPAGRGLRPAAAASPAGCAAVGGRRGVGRRGAAGGLRLGVDRADDRADRDGRRPRRRRS